MKIKIATLGWNGSRAAVSADDAAVGVAVEYVEIDGYRTYDAIDAKIEVSDGVTIATVSFAAAVEMVLVDKTHKELP